MTVILTTSKDTDKYGQFCVSPAPVFIVEKVVQETIPFDESKLKRRKVKKKSYTEGDAVRKYQSRKRYSISRQAATYKKIEWDLEEVDYQELISQGCHYCSGALNPTGIGLDRKDNSKGYSASNCVPCCGDCNKIKGTSLTYEEMQIAMEAVLNYRQNKE